MVPYLKNILAATFVLCAIAQALPSRPENSHIYDENRLVPAQQLEFFDRLSDNIANETGIVIDAVLLDDIGERVAAKYAEEIAEKWQADAGREGEVLIFVAQKQRRKMVVTRGTASSILNEAELRKAEQELLVPSFRQERYGDGILSLAGWLTFAISNSTGKKFDIDMQEAPAEEGMTVRGWIFVAVVFGLLIAFGRKGRRFGFFDNMKKLLCVSEIEKSQWPGIFQNAFGENLVSAFIGSECLMEGFDALETPWTINFILKDNSPEVIAKLHAYEKRAHRDNLQFGRFYSPAEIVQTLDTTPLEYLHIANRSVALCGIKPLDGFRPHEDALRKECASKLQEIFGTHADSRKQDARSSGAQNSRAKDACSKDAREQDALRVLYGVYYLETGEYPENNEPVLARYPASEWAELAKCL